MINLPPADWKRTQAQIAAASKQSMHAGTHFTAGGFLFYRTSRQDLYLLTLQAEGQRVCTY